MQEVQEKLVDSDVDQRQAMFDMIEGLFPSKGNLENKTIKLFTCLENLPIDWQVYIEERPTFSRQENNFTGEYWEKRNRLFHSLYMNPLTSRWHEVLEIARIMLSELRSLPALKQRYGSVLPYPENEKMDF